MEKGGVRKPRMDTLVALPFQLIYHPKPAGNGTLEKACRDDQSHGTRN